MGKSLTWRQREKGSNSFHGAGHFECEGERAGTRLALPGTGESVKKTF